MRIFRRLHELLSRRASASLCLCSSPCRQRRLSAPAPVRAAVDVTALPIAAIPLSVVLGRKEKPVSLGCAPEGAKSSRCVAHRPSGSPRGAANRMKNTGCRRIAFSCRSFSVARSGHLAAARRGRRFASADFSASVVAFAGRALSHAPRSFRVSGSVVAVKSGGGIVTQDAQPIVPGDAAR
jgi:hypothetical protein